MPAAPPLWPTVDPTVADLPRYGLDIETDTTVDGLDPRVAAVVAVAISLDAGDEVLDGDEVALLRRLDARLRGLPPGVLVTWNGGGFDLPFLADRAARHGLRLGLRAHLDPALAVRAPLPGHLGAYRATWHGHRHLDAYRVYKADVGAALAVSCGLKSIARLVGLPAVQLDAAVLHTYPAEQVAEYVASDARLARRLADRRWPAVSLAVDPAPPPRALTGAAATQR